MVRTAPSIVKRAVPKSVNAPVIRASADDVLINNYYLRFPKNANTKPIYTPNTEALTITSKRAV